MNKCEMAFLLSHFKKAIYNLERVKAYDETAVSNKTLEELKITLVEYQIKLEEMKNDE